MALKDFTETFFSQKKDLNIVICIYNKLGRREENDSKTPDVINKTLEKLQLKLKSECEDYEKVKISYVCETPLLTVRPFEILDKDAPVLYKRPCSEKGGIHDLSQVLFMGLVLLEQAQREKHSMGYTDETDNVENRLYLLTDEPFRRKYVNEIVHEEKSTGNIRWNPRFSELQFKAILYKTEHGGGDILEGVFDTIEMLE